MKASDLRLGNLITNASGEVITVTPFILQKVSDNRDWYAGLPLTKEWLKAFEFEPILINGQYKYRIDGFMFALRISKTGCVVDCGNPSVDTFKIYHVHHLQNLYQAHRLEELEYNEPMSNEEKRLMQDLTFPYKPKNKDNG